MNQITITGLCFMLCCVSTAAQSPSLSHEGAAYAHVSSGPLGAEQTGTVNLAVSQPSVLSSIPPQSVISNAAGACGDACTACGDACTACGDGDPCLPPWVHRTGIYGGFLYLRARDADVSYAAVTNGPIVGPPAPPIIVSPLGIVDPDYEAGFFGGLTLATNDRTSLDVRYTMLESSTIDRIRADVPTVVRSLVVHPSSVDGATDFLDARATLDIEYDTIDLDFRRLVSCGRLHAINVILGARYTNLNSSLSPSSRRSA